MEDLTRVELYLLIETLKGSVQDWENFDNDELMQEGIDRMKVIISKLERRWEELMFS